MDCVWTITTVGGYVSAPTPKLLKLSSSSFLKFILFEVYLYISFVITNKFLPKKKKKLINNLPKTQECQINYSKRSCTLTS